MQFIGTGDRILTENFNVGYLYTIQFKTGIYINSACIGIGDTFVMFQKAEPDLLFTLNVDTANEVDTIELYDSGGGTNDYDDLVNRPQINSHTLTGNMSGADLGLQATISDLDTIRAGAAAGATAVQPATLSDYQPVISDLDTIRAGAAAGATAVQPADMTSALAAKQDALSTAQLAAVNSGVTSADVEQITTNKNNISSLVKNGGGLNLLPLKTTYSIDSGTVTVNSDGTLRVQTSGSLSNNLIFEINTVTLPAGNYILSGCPANGSENTYRMDIVSGVVAIDVGTGASFTLTQSMSIVPRIRLVAGSSYDLTFKPMISQNSIPFQPYAMSNAELTDNKQEKNAINSGRTNFDDIKVGGTYFSGNVGTSQNAPTSGYFFLNVINGASDSILQEAYRLNNPDKVYRRQFITNAWSAWYVFTGTVVS